MPSLEPERVARQHPHRLRSFLGAPQVLQERYFYFLHRRNKARGHEAEECHVCYTSVLLYLAVPILQYFKSVSVSPLWKAVLGWTGREISCRCGLCKLWIPCMPERLEMPIHYFNPIHPQRPMTAAMVPSFLSMREFLAVYHAGPWCTNCWCEGYCIGMHLIRSLAVTMSL